MWVGVSAVLFVILAGIVVMGYILTVTGRLTIDTGWGRRIRPLGPQIVRIEAPRETVFDLIAVPYLSPNPPRELREKVQILQSHGGFHLAAHRTAVGGMTAITLETVTFERPERIAFRLVRGPVPYVSEVFMLSDLEDGASTELSYTGEMGTDGWALGGLWGRVVANRWEHAVASSLAGIKASAEQLAARRSARAERDGAADGSE